MRVTIVVAASTNNVIGRDGALPWHLPGDLRRFRQLTMGKPIVMGRRTHESIGRTLPGRRNIVISSRPALVMHGCDVAHSPDHAVEIAQGAAEIMIIGGERVYEQFLPRTQRVEMTRVHALIEGDAFFPALDPREWRLTWSETCPASNERALAFTFETWDRAK